MITILRSDERGFADHGWLQSYHTFSFADYYNPERTQFRCLRVLNEDYMHPARGFGTHPHRNMEILTYVLSGTVEHSDSMGFRDQLTHGDVQLLSAGKGIAHSEINPSQSEMLHLLQIWILPQTTRTEPRYECRRFGAEEFRRGLRLLASPSGEHDSVSINQDARVYAAIAESGSELRHPLAAGRYAWLQVARGAVSVDGHELSSGDAAAISESTEVSIRIGSDSELLLFDLP